MVKLLTEPVIEKCPIKTAFIISKLDEFQKDWREGADVKKETKEAIQEYVKEKYSDVFPFSNKTIENAITKARKQNNIKNVKGKRDSPKQGSEENDKMDNHDSSEQGSQNIVGLISIEENEKNKKYHNLRRKLHKSYSDFHYEYPDDWEQKISEILESYKDTLKEILLKSPCLYSSLSKPSQTSEEPVPAD